MLEGRLSPTSGSLGDPGVSPVHRSGEARKSGDLRLPRINKCNGEPEHTMDLETETPSTDFYGPLHPFVSRACLSRDRTVYGEREKERDRPDSPTLTHPSPPNPLFYLSLSSPARFLPSAVSLPAQREECFFESSHFSFVSVASVVYPSPPRATPLPPTAVPSQTLYTLCSLGCTGCTAVHSLPLGFLRFVL